MTRRTLGIPSHSRAGVFTIVFPLALVIATAKVSLASHFTRPEDAVAVSSEDLIERAKYNHDEGAIEELGRRKEVRAIPVLRAIATEPYAELTGVARLDGGIEARNRSHEAAKIALAGLGEEKYLNEFIVGLSSSVPSWKAYCIVALGRSGERKAAKYIGPFLFDDTSPVNPQPMVLDLSTGTKVNGTQERRRAHHGHQTNIRYSMRAALALTYMFPEVAAKFQSSVKPDGFMHINSWKRWWKEHRSEFENLK